MPEDTIDGQRQALQSSVPAGYVVNESNLTASLSGEGAYTMAEPQGQAVQTVQAPTCATPLADAESASEASDDDESGRGSWGSALPDNAAPTPAPAAVSTFGLNFSQAMDSLTQSELLQRAPDVHQGVVEAIFQGDPNLRLLTSEGIVEVPPATFFTLSPEVQGALKPSVIDPMTGETLDQPQSVEASQQWTDGGGGDGGDSTDSGDDAEPEMSGEPDPAQQVAPPADAKKAQDAAKQKAQDEALKQALTSEIVKYFENNHVPQEWIDKAGTFVSEGLNRDHPVDPRITAAVLVSESGGRRYRPGSNNPFGLHAGLARYPTPEAGIAAATKALHSHIFGAAGQTTPEKLYSGRGDEGGRMQHGKWVQDNYAGYCTSGCNAQKFSDNVKNAGGDKDHLDRPPVLK